MIYEISIPVLLLLITIILVVLVVLIFSEGKTNKRIDQIMSELKKLRLKVEKKTDEEKRIGELISSIQNECFPNHHPEARFPSEKVQMRSQSKEYQQSIEEASIVKASRFVLLKKIISNPILKKFTSEFFVGANLLNKIGIIIFALGVGYFVRYAIEQDWINETGRVAMGVACSGLMIFISHLMFKKYRAFSSIIVGGAIAILYYSFATAYHQYHLIDLPTTIVIVFIINVFAVFLSLLYERVELATIAMLGGFSAPLFIGFEIDQHRILFSYNLLLGIGALIIAFRKKWMVVNIIAFAFTALFYVLWLRKHLYTDVLLPYHDALFFMTATYLLYFVMQIVSNIRKKREFLPIELSILISITVMYYTAGMLIVQRVNADYKGLFTALIAVFNFVFLLALKRNEKADKNLIYLLAGLMFVFFGLVPPVQLVGKSVTLVWSLQVVLLLWLSQKLDVQLMRLGSAFMTLLMLISLGNDMHNIYISTAPTAEILPVFVNLGFITNIMVVIALAMNVFLLGRETKKNFFLFITVKGFRVFSLLALAVAFYLTFFLELKYHLVQSVDFKSSISVFVGIYNFALLLIGAVATSLIKNKKMYFVTGLIGVLAFGLYAIFYHFEISKIRNSFLIENLAKEHHFYLHYILSVALVVISVLAMRGFRLAVGIRSFVAKLGIWFGASTIVYIGSCELNHIMVITQYFPGLVPAQIVQNAHQLPHIILWAVFSLIFSVIGILQKNKTLRQAALMLFFITTIKLVIIEFNEISIAHRIAGLLVLGSVLLIVSFLYHIMHKNIKNIAPKKIEI